MPLPIVLAIGMAFYLPHNILFYIAEQKRTYNTNVTFNTVLL